MEWWGTNSLQTYLLASLDAFVGYILYCFVKIKILKIQFCPLTNPIIRFDNHLDVRSIITVLNLR